METKHTPTTLSSSARPDRQTLIRPGPLLLAAALAASLALVAGTATPQVASASAHGAPAGRCASSHIALRKTTRTACKKTKAHKPASRAKSTTRKTTPTSHAKTGATTSSTPAHAGRATPAHAATPLPPAVAVPATCVNAGITPTYSNLGLVSTATLCLVNQQRVAAGLVALRDNAALDAAAENHSIDMVTNDYFAHVTPAGVGVLQQVVAVAFATVDDVVDLAQNIAAGAGPDATPSATVTDWMNSPPHRANILDPTLRESGIGVVAALPAMLGLSGPGATYTQTFGTAAQ